MKILRVEHLQQQWFCLKFGFYFRNNQIFKCLCLKSNETLVNACTVYQPQLNLGSLLKMKFTHVRVYWSVTLLLCIHLAGYFSAAFDILREFLFVFVLCTSRVSYTQFGMRYCVNFEYICITAYQYCRPVLCWYINASSFARKWTDDSSTLISFNFDWIIGDLIFATQRLSHFFCQINDDLILVRHFRCGLI